VENVHLSVEWKRVSMMDGESDDDDDGTIAQASDRMERLIP